MCTLTPGSNYRETPKTAVFQVEHPNVQQTIYNVHIYGYSNVIIGFQTLDLQYDISALFHLCGCVFPAGNGLGIRVVGGKEIPGSRGEIGAYIAKVTLGGVAEQTGKVVEGMQVLEWNGVPLMGKTYEEVQCIMSQPCAEVDLCVRLDLNMLSDPDHPQALENHVQLKPGMSLVWLWVSYIVIMTTEL
uniref:PDZ domain-containing protein n=1 Tax=Hucho hucho TaxID=62062 RepID=A0A4W5L3M7_9TELE